MEHMLEKPILLIVAVCGLLAGAFGAMRIRAITGAGSETVELQAQVLAFFCVILAGIFAAVCGIALAGGLAYL